MKGCGGVRTSSFSNNLLCVRPRVGLPQGDQDRVRDYPCSQSSQSVSLLLANNASVYLKGTVKPTIDNRRQPSGVQKEMYISIKE